MRQRCTRYAVTGRDAQIAGQSPFSNPTTMAGDSKRPTKPKVEDQTLRRLGLLDLQTQCKLKGRNPYTTKLTPTSIGLSLVTAKRQPGGQPPVKALVRWATGKRLTNRLPKL